MVDYRDMKLLVSIKRHRSNIFLTFLLMSQELLFEEKLVGVPILVYANKQDLISKSN